MSSARNRRAARWAAVGRAVILAALCGWAGLGCGDDDKPETIYVFTDPPDAGGGMADGSTPMPEVDAGGPPEPTGMPEEGLSGSCSVDSNKIFELATVEDAPGVTPLAVDRIQSRFGYAFVNEGGGCSDALMLATSQGSAASLDPPMVDMAVDPCSLIESPAVEHVGDDYWLLAFVDNREGFGVWVHRFDFHDASVTDGEKLSEGGARKRNVALARIGDDRALVAWTEDAPDFTETLKARAIDLSGKPIGDEQVIASGGSVGSVGVSALGTGADGLPDASAGVVYRHATVAGEVRAELQVVGMDGQLIGNPNVLSENIGAEGSVSLVQNRNQDTMRDIAAGAAVYSLASGGSGSQVWLQLVSETGEPADLLDARGNPRGEAPPMRLVNAPARGTGASVARLRAGYAVAYRALSGGTVQRPTIRVMFLDRFGEVVGSSDVGYTTEFGGVTSIKVGADGRMVVGWSEYDEQGRATVKIARLPCT